MFKNLIHLGFPNNCVGCDNALVQNEKFICSSCFFFLPKGELNIDKNSQSSQLLSESPSFIGASHLFDFDKNGKTQHLLHELKYKSNTKLGVYLGELMGSDFQFSLLDIDYIVPVPLHPKKLYQRGYNQSEILAKGISNIISKPVNTNNLIRIKNTETQTKKSKKARIENVKSAFSIKDITLFDNKNILLIDDVMTTGSTLIECMKEIGKSKNVKIKVLALARALA